MAKKKTQSKSKVKAKSKANTKAKAKVKPKAKLKTKPKAKTKAKPKSQLDPKKYKGPQVGDLVPEITLIGTDGPFQLSSLRGKNVVLYFYPKDATPGCTIEGHDFSNLLPQFVKKNAVVYGISRDSLASHEKFKANQKYTVDLLSDGEEKACKVFDVIQEKNMYGNISMGVERSTFLIDPDGKLKKVWRKVKVDGHANEVLQAI